MTNYLQLSDIKELSPLIGGLIAGVVSIVAVAITSRNSFKVARLNINSQKLQKSSEIKIEKIEELFFLFDKWQINFSATYLSFLHCYAQQITYKQVIELSQAPSMMAPGEAQRFKMIMAIHFPELLAAYISVEDARKIIVPFLNDPQKTQLKTSDFIACQIAFEKACEEFKSIVGGYAQKILSNGGVNAL